MNPRYNNIFLVIYFSIKKKITHLFALFLYYIDIDSNQTKKKKNQRHFYTKTYLLVFFFVYVFNTIRLYTRFVTRDDRKHFPSRRI